MGLLLMQYEYQRAKVKCNILQRKGIRLNDKHERYTKRISDIQAAFSKKKTSIENKWSNLLSAENGAISGASANSASLFALASKHGISVNGISTGEQFASSLVGIATQVVAGQAGQTTTAAANEPLTTAAQQRNAELSMLANLAAQIKTIVQATYEAMKEEELAELELMEDAQLGPIEEKDAEMQIQIAENETLSDMAKERMEAAKGRLPDVVKGSVAHYGIG